MLESKFDDSSVIWFAEKKRKPLDPTRLQSAMFMDRPDLWKPTTHRHPKRVPPEQIELPLSEGGLGAAGLRPQPLQAPVRLRRPGSPQTKTKSKAGSLPLRKGRRNNG